MGPKTLHYFVSEVSVSSGVTGTSHGTRSNARNTQNVGVGNQGENVGEAICETTP
jgi:hypothetical protein